MVAVRKVVLDPINIRDLIVPGVGNRRIFRLFLTSGIPSDPVFAMERMLELVEMLRFTHGYRGYLHAKALAGAEPGQVERLVRLVDRVSYSLESPCQRALDEHALGKSVAKGAAFR